MRDLLLLTIFAIFVVSCTKENLLSENQSVNQTEDFSWKVSSDSLEAELSAIFSEETEYWQKLGVSKSAYLSIEVKNGYAYFSLYDNRQLNDEKAIVCKGSGIKIGKCVKTWLANNRGCLKIWEDNGIYYADDDC
tara:strand:- start:189 stop:593 length:405 start_codon:yes stop_codon:yes gene_type:complete